MLKIPRLYALVALLLSCGVPAVFSQSLDPNSYSGDGQSSQSDATDCTVAAAGCGQDNLDQMQQQQQPYSRQQQYGAGSQGLQMQTFGYPGLENTPQGSLLGQQYNQRNQLNTRPLPPDVPTEFQRFVAATTGQMLPIYGANLFRNVPSTFSPSDLAPATPSYVIEPNDELRVRIWGQVNFSGNLLVDRSGNIYLPQVGSVHVAGQPFSALDGHLRQSVGRIFRNFDLAVDLGRIRSMQVYVTGSARRPGVYTVSSLSTLVDALFASGGPAPQGSLRHIELKREGKTVADFDLYALLVRGDKSHDVQLMPEDVIYISPAGAQVAIAGSVREPGIYELREGETLGALLETAGKASTLASETRISIERMDHQQYSHAMDVTFDAAGMSTPLADGDILRIYPTTPAYTRTVVLRGNVANPGRFGWHDGMRLGDLIPDQSSLLTRDYWWQRSHLGLPSPEFEPFITAERSPTGTEPVTAIPPPPPSTLYGSSVYGAPGSAQNTENTGYSGVQQGNGSGSFQGTAQDYLQNYYYGQDGSQGASSQQQDNSNNSRQQGPAGSSGSLAGQGSSRDSNNPLAAKRNTVRLTPQEINWDYAVIERMDPTTLKTTLIPFDLGKLVLNHDASQNLVLQPGDTITIFSQNDIQVPLEQQTKYVYLEGEFVHAGIYSVRPGESLRDVVRRAGGLTPSAYLYGSEFDRESTRKLQQQRLDEYVQQVSMDADRGTQALAVSGTGAQSTMDVTASRAVSQQLVSRLSQVRATGRIVLQFQPDSGGLEDVPSLTLENGDRFTVPFRPATINVVGAVYNQNSFVFQPKQTVGHYLDLAGGPNRNADKRYSFVIRADGDVISRPTVKGSFGFMGSNPFYQIRLNPGDTVVMPDKTLRPTAIRNMMDWTQVFSQLALGAAAINVL